MAKKYNPWTGFLEDTAAKASVKDAAPIVGKKYTIRGKEFKVLEVKGDNVKVLGPNGIVNHLNIRMFDEKPTIDKAIHNCDESYTVSVKELSDRDASRVIGIAQRLGFTTKDKGYTIELIGGDQNMFNKFKREVVGIRGIKFI